MSETHWKKLTNPNYLGSWDIPKGQTLTLTIAKVIQEEIFNQTKNAKEMCTVIHFVEKAKPMVANKTNCKMIATLYNTPYIEQWAGKQITVQVEKVKAFGKLEEALRVAKTMPQQQPQAIICEECNNTVEPIGNYTAQQIAAKNQKDYGIVLCGNCSKKRKEQKQNENME